MKEFHDFRIESRHAGDISVFIDGQPLRGVRRVELELDVEEYPMVKLWIIPGTVNSNDMLLSAEMTETKDGDGNTNAY